MGGAVTFRRARLILACAFALLGACSEGGGSGGEDLEYASVDAIASALEEGGVACENLVVRDAEEIAAEREASGAPTPAELPPGAQGLSAPVYDVLETGMCQLEGAPLVGGVQVGTRITIFEDDEHLEAIPDEWLPGSALVYGSNWEVQVPDAGLARLVAESLGGKLVPPLEVPFPKKEVAALAPRCFFEAGRPRELAAAARQLGLPDGDPSAYAVALGDAMLHLPEELRGAATRACLEGFELEEAVRQDGDVLRSQEFERFWADACGYARFDQLVSNVGGGSFSFDDLGRELTRRHLGETSLPRVVVDDLARRCATAMGTATGLP